MPFLLRAEEKITFLLPMREPETITTTTGKTYRDPQVFNITSTSLEIREGDKEIPIPLRHLPPEIRGRYQQDSKALSKLMAGGINGVYREREGEMAMAGEVITLADGKFTYATFNDAGGGRESISGKFTLSGARITLHHPKIQFAKRLFVAVDGQLTLMRGYDFVAWKDGKRNSFSMTLYRRVP